MDTLENYLHQLDRECSEIIVLGDLNCDLSREKLDCHSSNRLIGLLNINQLEQIIKEPGRIT